MEPIGAGGASIDELAAHWADLLAGWGIPASIRAQAVDSPWRLDPAAMRPPDAPTETPTVRWEREVLPPTGATVLDVGCGAGRAAAALIPPVAAVVGVDTSGAMLDEFVAAGRSRGAEVRTVHGMWPEVAPYTPTADLVVCHHVVYNVDDIVPFVLELTDHARLAVVVEMPTRHPLSGWAPAWEHFWGVVRPDGPTHHDLVAILNALGLAPEVFEWERSPRPERPVDELRAFAQRHLCLGDERSAELDAWLADHPPTAVDSMATLRWPGIAAV